MPITLQQLCEQSNYLYGMRVLAGERNMSNIIQWVHTIEDSEASSFLHGGELVFTTGIAHQSTEWLLPFIQGLGHQKVSGIVINYGPYIKQVPREVIDYCEQVGFPLLEVPWKTKLVDITRDFCNQIIRAERRDEEIASSFTHMVLRPFETETQIKRLLQFEFGRESQYQVICLSFSIHVQEKQMIEHHLTLSTRLYLDEIIKKGGGKYSYFLLDDPFVHLVIVLCDYTLFESKAIVDWLKEKNTKGIISVSEQLRGLPFLSKIYNRALQVNKLGRAQEKSPLYYSEFGVEKILLSITEKETLDDYYRKTIGKLENFDQKNDTEYLTVLKRYIAFDGSVQKVAEESGVHRNTINYQLGKIKKILNNDLISWQDKFEIMMGLQIREIL